MHESVRRRRVCAACDGGARRIRRSDEQPPRSLSAIRTLTIIGTSDLHGALDRLPLLAGFIANVRAARAADGGGVLLVDAGDLFQGTLESNVGEGIDVVRAYNEMGYAASAIGNHELRLRARGSGGHGAIGDAVDPAQRPGRRASPRRRFRSW